jgi:hypothetical protein
MNADNDRVLITDKRHSLLSERNRYGQLSNRNRISVITSEFPDIPRKISEYLRTDLPSGANPRVMRALRKQLNSSDLCLRGIFTHCKMHHIGMRNGPYRVPKQAILHSEIGFIALRNGQYQNTERAFPDYDIGYMKRRHRAKRSSIRRI